MLKQITEIIDNTKGEYCYLRVAVTPTADLSDEIIEVQFFEVGKDDPTDVLNSVLLRDITTSLQREVLFPINDLKVRLFALIILTPKNKGITDIVYDWQKC
jgi:hypothetical protein